jgi:NADPH-dependent 2,4-dienoyl-CoA reductase/sulfur reductase-like enzyme
MSVRNGVEPPRVVTVGAGFAGLVAAKALTKGKPPVRVTLVEPRIVIEPTRPGQAAEALPAPAGSERAN